VSAIAGDSAGPPLQRLPSGWTWARLGDICDAVNGRAFKSSEWRKSGLPIIRIQNLKDSEAEFNYFAGELDERHRVRHGDLLFAWSGTPGTSFGAHIWKGADAALNQHIFNVKFDAGVLDSRYFCLALNQNVSRYVAQAQGGVGLAHITKSKFLDSFIPFAPKAKQLELVAELEKQFSRLDKAVANLKRVKANLRRQTAAILSAALRGELLERAVFPADADRPEFAPAISLASGWSWASAAEVCEAVASGSTPKPEEMTSGAGEVPFIKVYNLDFDGSLDFTVKPTFIRRAMHEGPLSRSRCLPGDVLMNIVGPPLGKVSLVPDAFPEWNINQAIVTFRAGPRILNRLLAYWLMTPPVQRRIERTAKATAGQYNVQVSTCRKLVLPIPPLDEQHGIVAELDRRLSTVREVEAEVDATLRRAQMLRQAVLGWAFASEHCRAIQSTGPSAREAARKEGELADAS